uniref:SPOC domain-containing protein n=1 Tax=Echinostoma caproni TaxID=27848 RepID=A0A183AQZ3_9TREM
LKPETEIPYEEFLTYLHSYQSPDKSLTKSHPAQTSNDSAPGARLFKNTRETKVCPSTRPVSTASLHSQQQSEQEKTAQPDSHRRSPSGSSSSSSFSSGSESSGSSSSSSSSDSTDAPSQSASLSPDRQSIVQSHSRIDIASVHTKTNQPSTQTSPDTVQSSPSGHHALKYLSSHPRSSQHTSRTPYSSSSPTAPRIQDQKRREPHDNRPDYGFRLRNSSFRSSRSLGRSDRDRSFDGHPPNRPNVPRPPSPRRSETRDHNRLTDQHTHHFRREIDPPHPPRDRKRFINRVDRAHQDNVCSKYRGGNFSSFSRRAKRPRTPSSNRGSVLSVDAQTRHCAPAPKEKVAEPYEVKFDHQNVDQKESPERRPVSSHDKRSIRDVRSSGSRSNTSKSKHSTLYTQRLQSRLEESLTADTTVPDVVVDSRDPDQQAFVMVDSGKQDDSHTEKDNLKPVSDRSASGAPEVSDSPATLPDPVCEPLLLPPQPSPVLSEPVHLLSPTPILSQSSTGEITTEPMHSTSTVVVDPAENHVAATTLSPKKVEPSRQSPVINSNENWSSFDDEVSLEPNPQHMDSVHADIVDECDLSIEAEVSGEGIKEEGEVADELDEDEEDMDNRSVPATPDRLRRLRDQREDRAERHDRRSWSRSLNVSETQLELGSPRSNHSPGTTRDRRGSPSHRVPDSTVLYRSSGSLRSETNHLGRESHGLPRTERHAYHGSAHSPPRNKARLNRDSLALSRLPIHSRGPLNPRRLLPRIQPGSRFASRRF